MQFFLQKYFRNFFLTKKTRLPLGGSWPPPVGFAGGRGIAQHDGVHRLLHRSVDALGGGIMAKNTLEKNIAIETNAILPNILKPKILKH